MLQLTPDLYLGKGRTRECYIHPEDPSKCVKVDYHDKGCRQTLKEAKYYEKLKRIKPGLVYDFIPHFHGMVETNLGMAGVFDIVRDHDGQVSSTLAQNLKDGTVARERRIWEKALDQFLARLMETGVILRDLNPGNLTARRQPDGSVQLVAIDGIGHRDFIPLCDYFLRIARRKLKRHIAQKNMDSIQSLFDRAERMARRNAERQAALAKISP
jgi:hypothetical protein